VITTDDGLRWHRVLHQLDAASGGECTTWRCVEFHRVLWMRQRPNRDADFVDTYTVDGIQAQHYHSAAEAIAASEANP
jgi:hypothetical protein